MNFWPLRHSWLTPLYFLFQHHPLPSQRQLFSTRLLSLLGKFFSFIHLLNVSISYGLIFGSLLISFYNFHWTSSPLPMTWSWTISIIDAVIRVKSMDLTLAGTAKNFSSLLSVALTSYLKPWFHFSIYGHLPASKMTCPTLNYYLFPKSVPHDFLILFFNRHLFYFLIIFFF